MASEFYRYKSNDEIAAEKAAEAEIKTDCFAYDGSKIGDYRCCALRELYCEKEKCSFYKPRGN